MKKFKRYIQAAVVLVAFAGLVRFMHVQGAGGDDGLPPIQQTPQQQTSQSSQQTAQAPSSGSGSAPSNGSQATPTPANTGSSSASNQGQYKDGTYTGQTANAYYGWVQVQVVISGGRIQNVIFLQHPNDNRTSQYINSQAMPMLQSEVIQAQSANVNIISGASATSQAFQQSLQSALSQAS